MTKNLTTLIKINEHALNEKRLALVSLIEEQENIIKQTEQMNIELEKQREFVSSNPGMGDILQNYTEKINRKTKMLKEAALNKQQEIDAIIQEIIDTFAEIKKFSKVAENMAKELELLENRKNIDQLDELAANNKGVNS